MTKRLLVWLELTRPHSALGAALAVWVGARLASAGWAAWWLAPMAVAWLLSAAGNAWNDAHDLAVDRMNRPQRPLPRGAATPCQARALAVGCAGLALVLAVPLGLGSTLGTLVGIGLLFAYTLHLRRVPLLGNAVVGLLTGMCVGYGGLLAGDVGAVWLPGAALGALFGAREVLKTLHDLPGDGAHGLRTVATLVGPQVALAIALLGTGAALALLGAWAGLQAGRWPLWALVALLSLATLLPLWHHPTAPRALHWALVGSKVLGLLVLVGLSVV